MDCFLVLVYFLGYLNQTKPNNCSKLKYSFSLLMHIIGSLENIESIYHELLYPIHIFLNYILISNNDRYNFSGLSSNINYCK